MVQRAIRSTGIAVLAASLSATAWAACSLDQFTPKIQSTGTGPFNSADSCVANVNGVGGGTAHTPGNDACASDNVVRTNDTYIYRFDYRVLAGQVENDVTFVSTLPLVAGRKVAIWDGLPPQCTGGGSSVSADGLVLTCNIGTVDRTGLGSQASALLAQVKATVYGADGDPVSNVVTSVTTSGPGSCSAANNPPASPPTVVISAKQKTDFRKDAAYGQQAYTLNGIKGFLVGYYIYMDQFDPAGASSRGGQSLNSPIVLKDVTSANWPAGSQWFDCFKTDGSQGTISCPAQGTSVAGGATKDITITAQSGEEGEFMVAGGKNTFIQLDPNTGAPQRLATFAARIFVPIDGILAAGGQLNLTNSIPAAQIVGTDLAGQPIVDVKTDNNELTQTVVASLPGGIYKYVANEWGYPWAGPTPGAAGTQYKQMQGTDNWGDSGTGLTFPNQYFYPRLDYNNPDINPATNVVICDSFNSTKVRVAEISSIPGQGAADIYATAGDFGQPSARFPGGYAVSYGVSPTQGAAGVPSRCDDSDATWYPSLTAATAAGARETINKVRVKIPSIESGAAMYFMIAHQSRPNLNGTIVDDYMSAIGSNLVGATGVNSWVLSGFDPVTNNGVGLGKRFKLTTAIARIQKEAGLTASGPNINQATAGGTVTYKLTPSVFSPITTPPTTYITIIDFLPEPLEYVDGTAKLGSAPFPPDSVQTGPLGTTLTWTINNVTPNVPIPTLTFVALVPESIPPNSAKVNNVEIQTPDDVSAANLRQANKPLTVLNPPGVKTVKSVAAPLIDPNGTGQWKLQISNFENSATTLDVIDVLPFAGDNVGNTLVTPNISGRSPQSNYVGTRGMAAAPVSALGGTVRYSSVSGATLNSGANPKYDPDAASNTPTKADGWCLETEFNTAGCPSGFGTSATTPITAFRVTGIPVPANQTAAITFDMPTQSNNIDNVYTNRFFSKSPGLSTLQSNDVKLTVKLGSIAGKVYYDSDRTGTNGGADTPIAGTTVTLCKAAPVAGACPAGQEVINPLTGLAIAPVPTNGTGDYKFDNVPSSPPGGYFVIETKPAGYATGPTNAAGSLGGTATPNNFSAIKLPVGANGTNYNFGHVLTDLNTTVKVPTAPVVPGSTVNASVTFANSTVTPGENTTATITLTPGLAGVVITPPAGWQFAPGSPAGGYDSATGVVKLVPAAAGGPFPGNSAINVGIAFTAPNTGTITVVSAITNTVGDITPITNPASTSFDRNAHQGAIGVIPMVIDVRKRAGTPRPLTNAERTTLGVALADNAYAIPYRVVVSNKGGVTATNVQLTDRLDFTFTSPAVIVGVFQGTDTFATLPGAALSAGAGNNAACAVSATAYNGVSQPNMLSGSFNLPPLANPASPGSAEKCVVEFTVVVNYAATLPPATALKNTAFASVNDNPNNPGPTAFSPTGVPTFGAPGNRASDASTDTPEVPPQTYPGGSYPSAPTPGGSPANGDVPDPTPVILGAPQQFDVRKSASAPVQLDVSGRRFRMAYTVNVTNTGAVAATNVQLSENLRFTFPAPATYVAGTVNQVTGTCGALNTAFDGGNTNTPAGYNLIGTNGISSQTLTNNGDKCVISFIVDVTYPQGGVPTAATAIPQNRIFGSSALGANSGPPFDATGTKAGDAPNMISKDTSANVSPTPAALTYGTPPLDPGAPATPKSDSGSGSEAKFKTLEVTKSVRGPVTIQGAGKYRVPYRVRVTAIGVAGEVLPNVQALDNLKQTFNRANASTPTFAVLNLLAPVPLGGATCSGNTAFNGNADQRLFAGTSPLTVGQACEFVFDVDVDYGGININPGPHQNTVFASSVPGSTPNAGGVVSLNAGATSTANPTGGNVAGLWSPPAGAIAIDASTDGVTVPTTAAGDNPQPTPVAFVPPSKLSAIKYVENLTVPRAVPVQGNDIQWTIVYKNEGNSLLNSVMVTDALDAKLINPVVTSAVLSPTPAGGDPQAVPNAAYNGVGVVNTLGNPVQLQPGQILTVKIKATVSPTASGQITNQASLSATEYGGAGPTGTKVPTSAINPGAPACPSAGACVPAGVTVTPEAIPSYPASGGAANSLKDQPNALGIAVGGAISGIAWLDSTKNGQIDGDEKRIPGLQVVVYAIDPVTGQRLKEVTNPTNRPVTDANGAYKVTGLPPSGPTVEYEVVFKSETGDAILGTPVAQATGASAGNNGSVPPSKDKITKIKVSPGQETPAQNLPLDPSGVVYDSITRIPVPGAVVTISGPPGFNPAIHLVGGGAQVSQTTGASGIYQYLLLPGAPAGDYSLTVVPPATYSNSTLIPPQAGAFPSKPPAGGTNPVVPNALAPQIAANDPTTYFMKFTLIPGTSADVIHNHIPLDPASQPKIALSKVVNKPVAELGDTVLYTVKLRNIGQSPLPAAVTMTDRLPAGFRYILGTSMVINPGTTTPVAIANPAGGVGATLVYTTNVAVPVNGEITYMYRVRLGVGSLQGDGINRVQAKFGTISSNEARAKVTVEAGVFTNDGCVAGKVFVDCNNNHIQDAEELGIPGVRLYMEDGTYFVTDSEGKYSYCGISPKSHVITVDMLTMPRGSRLTTTSNRNLGDGNSLFLDVKNGQLIRADFAEGSCSNTVLEQVKGRRTQGEVRSVETEKKGQPALKWEGKSPQYPQQGTDGANQPMVFPRPNNGGPTSSPEQNTPVPLMPGASSNTQGANLRNAK